MKASIVSGYLTGKTLIGLPRDDRFSVVFVCGQDVEGAIGLVINRPMVGLNFSGLLKQLDIIPPQKESTLYFGGPLEAQRGFVLHTLDYCLASTVPLGRDLGVTSTVDILRSISNGHGPFSYLIALGYTGWEAGQLEQEIQHNHWIVTESCHDLLFHVPLEARWKTALMLLGVSDPSALLSYGGRA